MKPLVSVIIPCYNQAQYLHEAIKSVLNQTYSNWECLIVDDGSPDNTEEVVTKWVALDKRFIYLKKENGGLSSARNFGIKKSTAEFILTLDADDFYDETFIEKGIDLLEENVKMGVVSSWGIRFIENKQFGIFKPTGGTINDFLFNNASIGTSLFRKKIWEEVGGYDESMKLGYEDWEFYIRVCKAGWNVHIIEEVLFFYRQNPNSMRIEALNNYDTIVRKYIFKKHKELYIKYYDEFLDHHFENVEDLKKQNCNSKNKIDYKLGNSLLSPLRALKSFFK